MSPPVADLGRASFSNVYVLALGHADLPGENLIEGILNQTVQHVCLPLSDSWLVNAHPGDKDNASFFSFYEVTEKLAIVIGTFVWALVDDLTGSMRNSIMMLMAFFIIGIIILSFLKSDKIKAKA